MLNKIGEATYVQIIFVGLVMFILGIAFVGIGYSVSSAVWGSEELKLALEGFSDTTSQISILKLFQFLSQLSIFAIPPIALVWVLRKKEVNFLCLRKLPDISIFFALLMLAITALPLIQFTMEINAQMHLPDFLKGMEDWMLEKETLAGDLTIKFLDVSTLLGFAVNIVVLAVMPAIGEELIFRGLLMKWFGKAISNIHVNIIIVAFLFSAIHMQFYGFIPRFLLGVLLGYTYYWTQSIWAPIWLHFVNNAFTVSAYFWVKSSGSDIDPEEVGNVDSISIIIVSVLVFSSIVWWIYHQRKKENQCI